MMGTRYKCLVTVFLILLASPEISHGCEMEGVIFWHFWQDVSIQDVFEGVVVNRSTSNILGIQSVTQTLTNRGPYMEVLMLDSFFIIRTNESFKYYEEYETSHQISVATTFNCVGGSTNSLTFIITVNDTNNNDPIFRPDDVYEFTMIPPLPPGFQITNNLNQIVVRDIDLTTQRIDFEILDNSYFIIDYDASSTTPKEFLASLKTTTFIRNIPETIEFIISATDVDLTGDPRRTSNATIRIQSDGSFELPEELVFSQTFYLADYTEENQIRLQEPITLQQGYHEQVTFSLVSDENSIYFEIEPNGNDVTFNVVKPIPADVLALRKLFIIVRADRELTSGTSATIIVQLPEVINLRFEKPIYEGAIIDNTLELRKLILSQGYENQIISVDIQSEYASNFDYNVLENQITIIMSPLSNDIITQNTFLNLKVVASTSLSSASTVITLKIVKDDLTTPAFEQALYKGTYDVVDGLTLGEIVLIQGYDDSVQVSLQGVHSDLFQMSPPGPNIYLTVSSIPVEIFKEQQILLTIEATKPRTVGASTAISISLPPEILLKFEHQNYNGKIIDNILELNDLVLSQGYETENIIIDIEHEYASSFSYIINGNSITLLMSPLDANVIRENTFLNLLVFATTDRSSASTVVTLEIVKNDKTTPIFEHSLYSGYYDPIEGLSIIDIVISQGYDDSVDVVLTGVHSDYFQLNETGPNINLELKASSLPPQLYSERHIFLTIAATKPRTVGANAAIVIILPSAIELEFLQDTNFGTIRENELSIDTIILSIYTDDVELNLTGEYKNHFKVTRLDSQITMEMIEKLPENIVLENDFIVLSLGASATNAINARTTVLLDIEKEDFTTPIFNEKIYTVDYLTPSSLNVPSIFLTQGYDDDTVSFRITGNNSEYFTINPSGNNVELAIQKTIPEELIFEEKVLIFNIIAEKPLTVGARAAISVYFPIELTEPTALAFSKTFYTGTLEQHYLKMENIELSVGFTTNTEFKINGAYEDYFEVHNEGNILNISQKSKLPSEVLNFKFIALELRAQRERAVPVSATIIVDIIQPDPVTVPVFSAPFYRAAYTEEKGLQFETDIVLSRGFDDSVTFELEEEYRDWFDVTNYDNLVLISLKKIPANVLESKQNIVFSIVAVKPGAINGIATIVIDLPTDVNTGQILFFERNHYLGSIEGNNVTLPAIVLNEGFTSEVQFSLVGDFQPFFDVSNDLETVTITLENSIPDDLIPPNSLIIVQLQATAPSALPAYTTIILEIIQEDDDPPTAVDLVFDETYYVGSYTATGGLQFDGLISLAEGYDENVQFYLEGESAQWFDLERVDKGAKLVLHNPIPPAVLANNQQLLFVIRAEHHTATARATIVVLLTEDVSAGQILGFERINYLGSIEGNNVTLPAIVLNEGFTSEVQFSLVGDFQPFFDVSNDLETVTITLENSIPDDLIPPNRLIIVQLQATAPSALPAYATIILEIIQEDDDPPTAVDLVFDETYYVGSYTATGGLQFDGLISLAEGYDENVQFYLEGESAQWFDLERVDKGAKLVLHNPIPPAVLANNQQLLFVIRAERHTATARATIVVLLTEDVSAGQILGFERINYLGSIEGNNVTLPAIVLNEGFTSEVQFSLVGDFQPFFDVSNDLETVTITLENAIPDDLIPPNSLIIVQLQATAPSALPAYTTIILEITQEDDDPLIAVDLVFDETYYVGSYTATGGLQFDGLISLAEGYDENVQFYLEGESAQWFDLERVDKGAKLVLHNPIPPAVLANNQQLLFVIRAERHTATARATIVVLLTEDVSAGQILGFERINYLGSIEGNNVTLPAIVLNEGFTSEVQFSLVGDFQPFFDVSNDLETVTITLENAIPDDLIPPNSLIIVQLQATAPSALPAYTTIILEIIQEDDDPPTAVDLVFDETYYVGSYTATGGLQFDGLISLAEGYDENVQFYLEGESAQWFDLERVDKGAKLVLHNPIPPAVLANNQQLLFVIRAERHTATARATIVVLLTEDVSAGQILGFERINYMGSIEGNNVTLPAIVLNEGFTSEVQFSLVGDFQPFFDVSNDLETVTITLENAIPDDLIPPNSLIIVQLQATAPSALPAYTTIILEIIQEDDDPPTAVDLVFDETYYVGSYTATGGLQFDGLISLAEGYDENVQFYLEGESAQWFDLERVDNGAKLVLHNPIPPAVLANNQQLLFVIRAERHTATARATIVVLLTEDVSAGQILGFERINYLGSIEGNNVTLPAIVLNEGFTSEVQFSLVGDFQPFFDVSNDLETVTITLENSIPDDLIPPNSLIIVQLQATAPSALPAYATIILEIIQEDDDPPTAVDLVFDETYYVGSYTATGGLQFDGLISLAEGYDENVQFYLEGESAQWFDLERVDKGAKLVLHNPIPPAVLANNQQLLFVIRAERHTATARATIVVLLTEDVSAGQILGFERINYLGSIEGNNVTLPAIVLNEGFTSEVQFSLVGDFQPFFDVSNDLETVTITLENSIPDDLIPPNSLIIVQLQATAPSALPAYATIILEIIQEDDDPPTAVDLVFDETYYVGSYTATGGLQFDGLISLAEGYDENVQFYLEGESAQWFDLERVDKGAKLVLHNPIPPAVLANNQQLLFVIRAERHTATARATIVVLLTEDVSAGQILGFERINYLGSIEGNNVTLPAIVLNEGFTSEVQFSLVGDFQPFFDVSNDLETVTITLENAIPDDLIPPNSLIIVQLQATAPSALPAYTTIILEIIQEDDDPPTAVDLVFDETYYVGSYTATGGLQFDGLISLAEGYDENVQFYLEGESAQWFDLERVDKGAKLVLHNPIPPAVLANNQQLLFVIRAERHTATARATIVVLLTEDVSAGQILGFERINYLGSIEGNNVTLPAIVLNEGFTSEVQFSLVGDFQPFFDVSNDLETVTITLENAIPDDMIPPNSLIIVQLQATAPSALPAYTTIILEIIQEDDDPPTAVDLVFDETYYVGSYTATGGLQFDGLISLAEGYDEHVQFYLEGESAQWFDLERVDRGAKLVLHNPIPPAVLANNQQLLFVIRAERHTATARATIIVLLTEDVSAGQILGFERINYLGSIEGNNVTLPAIVLNEGFTSEVQFSLVGDFQPFFDVSNDLETVTITLENSIPDDLIPPNSLIIVQLQATAPSALPAYTTIILEIIQEDDDPPTAVDLVFDETYYVGSYTATGGLQFDGLISLAEGYDENVQFYLEGESAQWFDLERVDKGAKLVLHNPIPPAVLANNQQLLFVIRAERHTATARATIVVLLTEDVSAGQILGFERINYLGSIEGNNVTLPAIVLKEGFTSEVQFSLVGDFQPFFDVSNDLETVTITLENAIPDDLIPPNSLIIVQLQATAPSALPAYTTIILEIIQEDDDPPTAVDLVFDETYYVGSYTATGGLQFDGLISLAEGYDENVQFYLEGESAQWFDLERVDKGAKLVLHNPIPPAVLANNQQLLFVIRAERHTATARATIVVLLTEDVSAGQILGFERIKYLGSIEGNNVTLPVIVLNEGFTSEVQFSLVGDFQPFFDVSNDLETVTITLENSIPDDLIPPNSLIIVQLQATAPSALPAYTTIILEIIQEDDDPPTAVDLVFDETYYVGSYTATGGLQFDGLISLAEGYDENVQFYLEGESAQWFDLERVDKGAKLVLHNPIPPAVLANNQQLLFVIRAERHTATARATIVVLLTEDVSAGQILGFERINYLGSIEGNNVTLPAIVLNEGFTSEVQFSLVGDFQPFFDVSNDLETVTITLESSIPDDLIPLNRLIIVQLQATAPSALPAYTTIILKIVIEDDIQVSLAKFDKVLYEGRIQGGIVQHEIINLSGFEPDINQIDIMGQFNTLFSAMYYNGVVTIETVGSLTLPADLSHVVLELRASNAAAVLILEVTGSDPPIEPNVIFNSESYVIEVEEGQTGTVGQVEAIADNGESVTYSLRLDNEHLQSRLSITNDGELRLSASADIGSYNFQVIATTVFTGTNGETTVYLSVHETTLCENNVGIPPLVVIDRDEEEPHHDLVTINPVLHAGCHYNLKNIWPIDQQWLYVDETGLHTYAIDREHPSIAFMALSQIKVELKLHCNTETRTKRSARQDWLGSYDYGDNTWLLGNTIEYDRKTTIVNLIVNDINDNAPIFVGKENEPIAIGYPVPDLISSISPRSLIELKATDADIGENAALMYWSSESQLAVSSSTGFVHVRNDAQLIQDMQLVVSATDLNGQGLTGTISLIIKLLDINNIAVLTVENAFLEDESIILSNLSSAVGYDVKALKSVVVSNSEEQAINTYNRGKRDVNSNGHSLQIHVYGLLQREPVLVEKLSENIIENAELIPVTITRIASLEEHLQVSRDFSGSNLGLLVSTIVLSVLLFLVIVAAVVVWFIFLRRKVQNYERFSESNSISSKTETPIVTEMKPDTGGSLPRLNIEELKRSERRLQDMLNAPIEDILVEPITTANNSTIIPINPIDNKAPIIIQDKLKDGESSDEDEYGERKKGRRKSVVTFNENVEKIIHVEDNPDENNLQDDNNEKYEIYKL